MFPSAVPDNPENELQRQADVLSERCGEELDETLRRIGLYHPEKAVVTMPTPDGMTVAAIVVVQVGDLALADPQMAIEEADRLERDAETDQFLDARARWRALLEGGDDDDPARP